MDSNDRERVGEAREELTRMINEDELRDAILLVFANKQVSHSLNTFSFAPYITRCPPVFLSVVCQFQSNVSCGLLFAGPSECDECSRNHRQVGAS